MTWNVAFCPQLVRSHCSSGTTSKNFFPQCNLPLLFSFVSVFDETLKRFSEEQVMMLVVFLLTPYTIVAAWLV